MAKIVILNLDEGTSDRLRIRAAQHKRTVEEEASHILRSALAREVMPARNLAESIRTRFESVGGVELAPPARGPARDSPELSR